MTPKKAKTKNDRMKALKARCDKAFSLYIRRRDKGRCYTCGTTEGLQCGHLITREKMSTRWDPMNANAQCASCNLKHEHYPEIFTQKWIAEHGQDAYDSLVRKAWTPIKRTEDDLKTLAEALEELAAEADA